METTLTETAAEARSATSATREGLKGLFQAQNILLDYANEQNAIAFKAVRERLKAGESSPSAALIDSIEEIFEGVVAMQKSIVDFGASRLGRETETKVDEPKAEKKERRFPKFPFAELVRKNFEASVAAQREILGLLEKQGKLGVKAADGITRKSARAIVSDAAAMAKEAVENVLDTQTKLADLAARQAKENLGLIAAQEKPLISKEMAHYAEEGIDNLRRAQTQLIDIASELNARVYERAETAGDEPAASKIAERIEKGIERVVKTQNEMLDAGLRAVNRRAAVSSN